MAFNYVSFCSGIGGFEQALNKLGGICVMAAEYDEKTDSAYKVLYGFNTAGDIRNIEADTVPDHKIMVAGIPCQTFSLSGRRGGFSDARGTVFFEVARIAKAKQPPIIILENVRGIVNHDKGRTIDIIIKTLDEIGYTIDFNMINSRYFAAAQNRDRFYCIAIRKDLIGAEAWAYKHTPMINRTKSRLEESGVSSFNFQWPEGEKDKEQIKDILDKEADEKYFVNDEKVRELTATTKRELLIYKVVNKDPYKDLPYTMDEIAIREATKKGYAMARDGDAVNIQYPKSKTRRGRIGRNVANTLEASGINQAVAFKWIAKRYGGYMTYYRLRKFTPKECFRLQRFPEEVYTKLVEAGYKDTLLYKFTGNAVTVTVVYAIAKRLVEQFEGN